MEVNYLKLGDKTYAINEIQGEALDVNAELKEFYEERHGALAEEFGTTLSDNMQSDWDSQIAHLQKFNQRGEIAVPTNMFNKLMTVHNGILMECRVVQFAPNEISCTGSWAYDRLDGIDYDADVWQGVDSSDDLVIRVQPLFRTPVVYAYDKKGNRIYTPFTYTYHTMGSRNLCTGNHKASDFWGLPDDNFAVQMNKVNTFSPARQRMEVGLNTYEIRDLITNESIISVTKKGSDVWRA